MSIYRTSIYSQSRSPLSKQAWSLFGGSDNNKPNWFQRNIANPINNTVGGAVDATTNAIQQGTDYLTDKTKQGLNYVNQGADAIGLGTPTRAVTDLVGNAGDIVGGAVNGIVNTAGSAVKGVGNLATGEVTKAGQNILDTARNATGTMIHNGIVQPVTALQGLGNNARDIVRQTTNGLQGVANATGNPLIANTGRAITNAVNNGADAMVNTANKGLNAVGRTAFQGGLFPVIGLANAGKAALNGDFDKAGNNLMFTGKALTNAIKEPVKGIYNTAAEGIGGVYNTGSNAIRDVAKIPGQNPVSNALDAADAKIRQFGNQVHAQGNKYIDKAFEPVQQALTPNQQANMKQLQDQLAQAQRNYSQAVQLGGDRGLITAARKRMMAAREAIRNNGGPDTGAARSMAPIDRPGGRAAVYNTEASRNNYRQIAKEDTYDNYQKQRQSNAQAINRFIRNAGAGPEAIVRS